MAFLARGKKEDLVELAEELGVEVPPQARVVEIRTLIKNSENFVEDEGKDSLQRIIEDRYKREEREHILALERLKLDYSNNRERKENLLCNKLEDKETIQLQNNSSLHFTNVESDSSIKENNKASLENFSNVESSKILETNLSSSDNFKDEDMMLTTVNSCEMKKNDEIEPTCSDVQAHQLDKNYSNTYLHKLSVPSMETEEDRNSEICVNSCNSDSLEEESNFHLLEDTMKELAEVKGATEIKPTNGEFQSDKTKLKSSSVEFVIVEDDVSCARTNIVDSDTSAVQVENSDKEFDNKADKDVKRLHSSNSTNYIAHENGNKSNVSKNVNDSTITGNILNNSLNVHPQDFVAEGESDLYDLKCPDTSFVFKDSVPVEVNDDLMNMKGKNQDLVVEVDSESLHYVTKTPSDTPELGTFQINCNVSHVVNTVNAAKYFYDGTEISGTFGNLFVLVENLNTCAIAGHDTFEHDRTDDCTQKELTKVNSCDSDLFAYKENDGNSSNQDNLAKISKSRKAKLRAQPLINFRHKTKMKNSKTQQSD